MFRNEGVDTRHNPEFTLMELYQAYTDYYGMMELTENMFRYLAEKVCGSAVITYNGVEIDLSKPFARLTMNDAIKKYAGIDFDEVKTDEEAKALAKAVSYTHLCTLGADENGKIRCRCKPFRLFVVPAVFEIFGELSA